MRKPGSVRSRTGGARGRYSSGGAGAAPGAGPRRARPPDAGPVLIPRAASGTGASRCPLGTGPGPAARGAVAPPAVRGRPPVRGRAGRVHRTQALSSSRGRPPAQGLPGARSAPVPDRRRAGPLLPAGAGRPPVRGRAGRVHRTQALSSSRGRPPAQGLPGARSAPVPDRRRAGPLLPAGAGAAPGAGPRRARPPDAGPVLIPRAASGTGAFRCPLGDCRSPGRWAAQVGGSARHGGGRPLGRRRRADRQEDDPGPRPTRRTAGAHPRPRLHRRWRGTRSGSAGVRCPRASGPRSRRGGR